MTLNLGSAYYADGETCVGQNFSHFLPAETDYTIERCFKEQVYPTVPIQDASRHINFNIEPSSYFLDLAETSLEMVLKIVKGDKSDMPAPSADFAGCGFDQSPATTIIKDLDVKLSGVSVSPVLGNYAHTAHMTNLLSFQSDCRNSKLERIGK